MRAASKVHRERENGDVVEIANSAVVRRTSVKDVIGKRPPARPFFAIGGRGSILPSLLRR